MIKLTDDTMCMTFDRKLGRINSLKLVRDPLQTEFVGNQNNISYRTIIEKINGWVTLNCVLGMKSKIIGH